MMRKVCKDKHEVKCMLPAERRQFILNELYKNKAVTVNDLAQQLDVTTRQSGGICSIWKKAA